MNEVTLEVNNNIGSKSTHKQQQQGRSGGSQLPWTCRLQRGPGGRRGTPQIQRGRAAARGQHQETLCKRASPLPERFQVSNPADSWSSIYVWKCTFPVFSRAVVFLIHCHQRPEDSSSQITFRQLCSNLLVFFWENPNLPCSFNCQGGQATVVESLSFIQSEKDTLWDSQLMDKHWLCLSPKAPLK